MNESLFPDEAAPDAQRSALVAQYERIGRPVDDLPYTEALSAMCAHLARPGEERAVLDELLRIRKQGKLPQAKVRPKSRVKLDPEQERVLSEMIVESAGSMGGRDRLPHTGAFDDLLARFNAACGLQLDAHDLWRLVARLAK